MLREDAVKARIKTIEGKMLGLMHKLNRYRANPNAFSNTHQHFNHAVKRPKLNQSFHVVGLFKASLEQQISALGDELYTLRAFTQPSSEFTLAAL